MRSIVLAADLRVGVLLLGILLIGGHAAAQVGQGQQQAEKLELLPLEDVEKQVEAARDLPPASLPTTEARKRVVAKVNGEDMTVGQVLREVLDRFGGPLVPQLLNQHVMNMEAEKRGTKLEEKEFLAAVQLFLAQKKSIQTKSNLRAILKDSGLGWRDFETLMRDKARVEKIVRKDLGLPTRPEPLNPFVLQIWAGQKLQGKYQMELNTAKLPEGVAGKVSTTRKVSSLLRDLPSGAYGFTLEGDGDNAKIIVKPTHKRWPRYTAPNIAIDKLTGEGKREPGRAIEAFNAARKEVKSIDRFIAITQTDGGGVKIIAPVVTVKKKFMKQQPTQNPAGGEPIMKDVETPADVALPELIDAVANKGFVIKDGAATPKDATHPSYAIPTATAKIGGSEIPLIEALAKIAGKPSIAQPRFRLNGQYEIPDAPIPMVVMLDRETLLQFVIGRLEKVHFDEAIRSLSRFMRVKSVFAAKGVKVDEAKVAAQIQAENAKFNNPIFNRAMILQAQGKTEFDEDRRLWIGNGVDQLIGTDNQDADLRSFWEKNILWFGNATVDASHILVDKVDPETGKVDWDQAERKIDKIAMELLSQPNPSARFGEMAKRFSDDKASASQGGKLGPFGYKGQMVKEFTEAAFALRQGEVSAPVKTVHGFHLILCNKVTPPDRDKHAFDKPEMRERVREAYQQERRDEWLEANVYKDLKVEELGPVLSTGS